MRAANALVVACALVVLAGALPVAVTSAGSASATAVTLGDDATVTGEPGETVTLTVRADATGVSGYQANLTFDPSVVEVQSVSKSEDFEKPVSNANNDAGWVSFNQVRSSGTDDPVLATVTFTVTGEAGDSTELSFAEEDTKFADGDGETFSPQTYDGAAVSVESATPTPNETPTPTSTPTSTPNATPTSTPTDTPSPAPAPTETPDDDNGGDGGGDDANNGGDGDDGGDANNGGDGDDDDDGGDAGGVDSSSLSTGEPSLAVTNVTLNTSSPVAGRPVTVSAVVENTGDAGGEFDTQVYVDENATEANRTVEVAAGQRREVNLSLAFDSSGTHTVAVGNVSVDNVSVRAVNATDTPASTATETSTETATETATQSATAAQSATATSSETATPAEESPTSAPTETETVTEPASEGETTESAPGFGFGITVGTLATLAGWAGMRRGRDD